MAGGIATAAEHLAAVGRDGTGITAHNPGSPLAGLSENSNFAKRDILGGRIDVPRDLDDRSLGVLQKPGKEIALLIINVEHRLTIGEGPSPTTH